VLQKSLAVSNDVAVPAFPSSDAVTIPETIPASVIVVADPTVKELVTDTSFGRPTVILFPEPTVSISFVVPAIVRISVSRSIESVPPVSP
jgi:hypothetical protein